ncbi:hypothetical protein EAI_11151 [Harpegnathos saltator]|uniref:TNFR-Cys domain-containing protein n=1 Tax=Harpegnathos saltator TaxID=610380 RepID=E2BAL3_HARSA|nr:hypothetical protein EAI_11151 [Harpegnathos saltator]
MPRESCRGLLLTLVSVFVGLYESAGATSSTQYPICKPGLEFWSTDRASCWPCTRCTPEFTLSPCVLHNDAICGPLSALELDWSFLSTRKRPEAGQRHLETVTSKPQAAHDPRERRKSTSVDNLPWDWQTGALVLAVCTCIVFFLVAGCSALVYARQWRRMKKNFEPGTLRRNFQSKADDSSFNTNVIIIIMVLNRKWNYRKMILTEKMNSATK